MKDQPEITSPVLVLVGPTAIGKTDLSFAIADEFDCEIVSMDSMQVYRYMDIGTAKPTPEEQRLVRHHLIDIVFPDQQYNAARFVRDALAAINAIVRRGRIPLLTGGTGLYLTALTRGLFEMVQVKDSVRDRLRERLADEGREVLFEELAAIDPESAARIHVNDSQRLLRGLEIYYSTGTTWSEHIRIQKGTQKQVNFINMLQLCLSCDRDLLARRIEQRSVHMLKQGLVQEVEQLLAMGYGPELSSMQSIGYRHAVNFLAGTWDRETATQMLIRDTKRYAKRQRTWFCKNPDLLWFDRGRKSEIMGYIRQFINQGKTD